jgi:hypothetical protein
VRIRVELTGERFDLDRLASCCPLTGDEGVWSENDHHYLAYPSLDELADAPGVLMDQAASTLTTMNGITRAQHENYHPVTLGGQFADLHSGAQHAVVKVAAVRARTAVVTARVVVTGTEPAPSPVPQGICMARLATTHPQLREVLNMMGAPEALGWVTLYKIFEIIQHDVGKIHSKGWGPSKGDVELFTRSAQSDRHGVQRYDPPPDPMSLPQAQGFVRILINNWSSDMTEGSAATVEADLRA